LKLQDIEFFISEAFIGMRRSGLMILIAIGTITVSLIIFGFFLLTIANLNHLANFVTSKLEVRAFLKESLTQREVANLEAKIAHLDGVKTVSYIPKSEAWSKFKTSFNNVDLSDYVDHNPFPNAIRVKTLHSEDLVPVANQIKTYTDSVDDVIYGGSIAEKIDQLSHFIKYRGIELVALFTIATLLIVMNTIRLTVIARQNEIEIMQLVGATKSFVKWPFIIEGLFLGLAGSCLAVAVLRFRYLFFAKNFQSAFPLFPLLFDKAALTKIYVIVCIVGTTLGIIGAYISVSRSLKTHK